MLAIAIKFNNLVRNRANHLYVDLFNDKIDIKIG